MSLRPPSSPSPSPGPENGKQHARQSLGPSARGTPMAPGSPRLGGTGTRPTSELVGSAGMYQTPEAEALDQWFENLQNYEATLEDMAAASLDANFKEELSAIEQWFKVLSEAERTAALYSLLQHSTQVQIRFFITVLQQMARSDPMTALLSPAVGGSMQAQMEAKLASLKSPGLKSGLPQSPTARSFNPSSPAANRQSLIETPNNYLSPDSAVLGQSQEAANTLAQQRAKLKAANAAHRISAPIMPTTSGSNTWGAGGLGQVVETTARAPSPSAEEVSSRPKSTEFTSTRAPVAAQEASLPSHAASESWASMVTTPLPMFAKTEPKEPSGQAEWRVSRLVPFRSFQPNNDRPRVVPPFPVSLGWVTPRFIAAALDRHQNQTISMTMQAISEHVATDAGMPRAHLRTGSEVTMARTLAAEATTDGAIMEWARSAWVDSVWEWE
ncbi:unnamed protein product [Mycena citricolor]|uniref:RNA-binding protein vts1-like alpha-helical domain-containing protein n=1 Tax=Mycena citricolor TaxID=2018698 RepID=A0AAD2K947_9AGAR|nr:unnamed protein product [Mycena citricolor]